MSDIDSSDNDFIEKPKKKRNLSQKQIEHLRKIQPKATEAKRKNKEIVAAVKSYEKARKPKEDYEDIKKELGIIREHLSQEAARKAEKRAQKQAVDKDTYNDYAYSSSNLFR
jgi:hypothetical protein